MSCYSHYACGGASVEKFLSMILMSSRAALLSRVYDIITSSQSIRKSSKTRKKERKKRSSRHQLLPRKKEEKREKSANNNEVPKIFSAFSVASRFGSPATTKGMNAILSSDFNRSNVSPMDFVTPSSFVAMRVVVLPPRLDCKKSPPPFRCTPNVVLLVVLLCRDAQEQQGLLLLPGADVVDMVSQGATLPYSNNVDKMTLLHTYIPKKREETKKKSPKCALGPVPHADSKRVSLIMCTEGKVLFFGLVKKGLCNCLGFFVIFFFFFVSLCLSFFFCSKKRYLGVV